MRKFYLYELYDPRLPHETRYIGVSYQPKARRVNHMREALQKSPPRTRKVRWILKLARSAVVPEMRIVGEYDTVEAVLIAEEIAIAAARAAGHPLTNSTAGGRGTAGYKLTKAQKARQRAGRAGLVVSEAARANISKGKTGKKWTAENKAKLSKARTGRVIGPASEQRKRRISKSLKGHPALTKPRGPLSEEHKRRLSEANKGKAHSPVTQETKDRISKALSRPRQPRSEETKARISATLKARHQGKHLT